MEDKKEIIATLKKRPILQSLENRRSRLCFERLSLNSRRIHLRNLGSLD